MLLGLPGLILVALAGLGGWAWLSLQQAPGAAARQQSVAVTRTLAGSLAPFAADASRYRFDGITAQLESAVERDTDRLRHARFIATRPDGSVVVVASDQPREVETVPDPEVRAAFTAGQSMLRLTADPQEPGGLCVGEPVRDGHGHVIGYLHTQFAAVKLPANVPALVFAVVGGALWLSLLIWFVVSARADGADETSQGRLASAFRALFGQRVVGMIVRPAGAPPMANAAAAEMLGRDADLLAATPLPDLLNPDDAPTVRGQVHQLQTGAIDGFVAEARLAHHIAGDGHNDVYATIVATAVREALGDTVATLLVENADRGHGETAHLLHEAEERFRAVFHNATVGVGLFSPAGKPLQVNPRWATMFGFEPDEPGRDLTLVRTHPDQLFESHDQLRRVSEGEIPGYRMETRFIRKDNSEFTADLSVAPIRDAESGRVEAVAAVVVDLSEARLEADNRVKKAESRFHALFDAAPDAICVLGSDWRIRDHNRSAINLSPESPVPAGTTSFRMPDGDGHGVPDAANLRGRTLGQLMPEAADVIREGLQRLVEGEEFTEINVQTAARRDCDSRDLWMRAVPLKDLEGKPDGALVYVRDISRRRQAERELEKSTMFDAVTGLARRTLFVDRLSRALARTRRQDEYRMAVLALDIDNFKAINDSLGHRAGDELLREAARRLREIIRTDSDDTASRVGGDEFVLMLDGLKDPDHAQTVAQRALQALAQPFKVDGQEVYTNASIGIALNDIPYERAEEMMRDANIAMYRAKATGRAKYVVFDREMHERAVRRLRLETDLQKAAERNELRLHYQPIVSLLTGRIDSFEALVRWEHPEHGMIRPDEFIPVAEETGLINRVGAWVLRESCRQAAEWRERFTQYTALGIHMNLSARQFAQPDLVEQIETELRSAGIEPALLGLEVTESALMDRPDVTREALERLETLGSSVHIDDFGTGYSSLSYLHSFPFGTLKIDRSFVMRMRSDQASMEIVRTIIALSRSVGFEVIAEGVETIEQLGLLKQLGCDFGQGYYFSRPLAAHAAEDLLAQEPVWKA